MCAASVCNGRAHTVLHRWATEDCSAPTVLSSHFRRVQGSMSDHHACPVRALIPELSHWLVSKSHRFRKLENTKIHEKRCCLTHCRHLDPGLCSKGAWNSWLCCPHFSHAGCCRHSTQKNLALFLHFTLSSGRARTLGLLHAQMLCHWAASRCRQI